MSLAWYDIVGIVGVATIVITYFLLQIGRIRSKQLAYSALNAVGALFILVSLWSAFNLPSVVVEVFWLLISLFGIAKSLSHKDLRT
jgi:hypothetical protein